MRTPSPQEHWGASPIINPGSPSTRKKRAFRDRDGELLWSLQKQLKINIRDNKEAHRRKLENKHQLSNIQDWSGVKIADFKLKQIDGNLDRANDSSTGSVRRWAQHPPVLPPVKQATGWLELQVQCTSTPHHQFSVYIYILKKNVFLIFILGEHQAQISVVSCSTSVIDLAAAPLLSQTTSGNDSPPATFPSCLSVSSSQVKKQLEILNRNKAAGPFGVSPRVLKACADQLCGILQYLFNISLSQEKVLVVCKISSRVPAPKRCHPSSPNDYRHVALTFPHHESPGETFIGPPE